MTPGQVCGTVHAMTELLEPSVHRLLTRATQARVPSLVPWPMPAGWAISGIGRAVDGVSVVACSGPDLLDGLADLFVICEEPGGRYGPGAAGAVHIDGGVTTAGRVADAHLSVDDRSTPMWRVECDSDRDVLLGEAAGRWLWLVAFPNTTSLIVSDDFRLASLNTLVGELELIPMTGLTSRSPW